MARHSEVGIPTGYILGNMFMGLMWTGPDVHRASCAVGSESVYRG
jgi:hypothetical protein